MRPRKRVLIWTECTMTRSVLRIVLDARGYKGVVLEAESEIWALAPTAHVCLVVGLPPADSERIQQRLYRESACATVVACARGVAPESTWMEELLDQVHRATLRKRGPTLSGILHARARAVGANEAAAMARRSGKDAAA